MPSPARPPRVSIIVRTKDRPLLLARALDDLLGQSFREWEAIVVNDGGVAAKVDALVAERSDRFAGRATVLHIESSLGMEGASNRALERARGDYLVVHDDDDTWDPAFLDATVAHLDENDSSVAVAVRTEIVVERVEGERIVELERQPFGPPHDVVTLLDLILINRVVPIGLLVRREQAVRLGGFDESLPVVGDWEFNLRLARAGRIDFLPATPLAFWHQRPDNSGALANSMGEGAQSHAQQDRIIRDRMLRSDLREGGIGQLLYLSMLVDEVVTGAERRIIDDQRRAIEESERRTQAFVRDVVALYSPVATVRRALRRILRRR